MDSGPRGSSIVAAWPSRLRNTSQSTRTSDRFSTQRPFSSARMASSPSQLRVCSSAESRSSGLIPRGQIAPASTFGCTPQSWLARKTAISVASSSRPGSISPRASTSIGPSRSISTGAAWLRSATAFSYAGASSAARAFCRASDSAARNSATSSAYWLGVTVCASTSSPISRQTAWPFSSTTNRHGATDHVADHHHADAAPRVGGEPVQLLGLGGQRRGGEDDDLGAPQLRVRVREPGPGDRVDPACLAGPGLVVGAVPDVLERVGDR